MYGNEDSVGFLKNIKNKISSLYSNENLSDTEYERYLEKYQDTDEYGMPLKDSFWQEWSLKEDTKEVDEEYIEWKKQHENLENVNLSYFSEPDMVE